MVGGSGTTQLVFVHGIGGPRDAAEERREWLNLWDRDDIVVGRPRL